MRIGTWNLDGRRRNSHETFLDEARCDVWLLTEVPQRASLTPEPAPELMAPGKLWATVWQPKVTPPKSHATASGTSAYVERKGVTSAAASFPGRTSSDDDFGAGAQSERTRRAVAQVGEQLPGKTAVWGGDFNHSLMGRETAGSLDGRAAILEMAKGLGLQIPTAGMGHRIDNLCTIDHIAVPWSRTVHVVEHLPARVNGSDLSDHDAYVVEVTTADT